VPRPGVLFPLQDSTSTALAAASPPVQQIHEPERIMNILDALEHQSRLAYRVLNLILDCRQSLVAHTLHGLLAPGHSACAVVVVHKSQQMVSDTEESDHLAWPGVLLERLAL
jgi:hypothetical protein